MTKLMRRLEKPSFLRNLFLALLALVLAVTVLLTAVLSASYFSAISTMTNRYFANLLKQCNYSITYLNDLAERISASLSYDRNVIAFLNLDHRDNMQAVVTHQSVRNTIMPLSYVDSVYLYNHSLDLLLCTKTGTQDGLDSFHDQAVVQRILALEADPETPNPPLAHKVFFSRSVPTAIYSYVIPDFDQEGRLTSALVINISINVLTNSLRELNANNTTTRYAVTDAEGSMLIPSPFQTDEEESDFRALLASHIASGEEEGEMSVKIGSTRYLLAYTTANSNGWYIYAMVPRSVVYSQVLTTALLSVAAILVLLVLFCVVALQVSQRLNRPVEVINQLAQGENPPDADLDKLKSEEFRTIATAFNRIRQENDEFSKYKEATSRIVRKEFLESLFCGTAVYSQAQCREHLESLDCQWLLERPLVMCLLSIDNYTEFAQQTNPREREALRFAVINVATELLEPHFFCAMVEHSSNRFIIVLSRREEMEISEAIALLERTLQEIIQLVQTHLQFSLTAAYGTSFRGTGHMPRVYENLEELLMLRLRYGHGRVLTPQMAEDLELDDFQVSTAAENLLTSSVSNGSSQQALAQFDIIARDLFRFSPSEILPYLLHLAYRLLNTVKETDNAAGVQATTEFKTVASRLPQCEIEDDYRRCFTVYLEKLCAILTAQKAAQESQNSNILVHRILKIIESDYPQKELCLNSIADDLGLSTHYVGQIFRADQGKSVSQYLLDLRLEKVAEALRESDRPFSQIMEDMGFEAKQKNYIYTLFKKHFGVTVKAYRAQFSGSSAS